LFIYIFEIVNIYFQPIQKLICLTSYTRNKLRLSRKLNTLQGRGRKLSNRSKMYAK